MQKDASDLNPLGFSCPVPLLDHDCVLMAHGGGGRLMNQLIERLFIRAFDNPLLDSRHDGAVVEIDRVRLAFTTDSYVVKPLFFPGGDIGSLAVNGTVNDLAMCGARPRYLSVGFILEEGLPMETLGKVVDSMRRTADAAQVALVTGDTKVVERGKGDGLYINTAGIGVIETGLKIGPSQVVPGDVILLSGDLGRHGIAIMAAREGLAFQTDLQSDCASLAELVLALLKAGVTVHCMRDLTRGGLASGLVEIAETSRTGMTIEEHRIAVCPEVRGACEMLGFDPVYVANEGRFVAFVDAADAERALEVLRSHPLGAAAASIGHVHASAAGTVRMKSPLGTTRMIDRLSGEQLPRIC
jgi:hydrogenase expression/formation protein HypE